MLIMEKLEKFAAMGLSENILKALEAKGFEEPSQIQEQTIPLLLNGDLTLFISYNPREKFFMGSSVY